MNALRRLSDAYFAPAPARWLGLVRLLVGSYAVIQVLRRTPRLVSFARFDPAGFRPVGLVSMLDAPLPPALTFAQPYAAAAVGALFAAGAFYRVSGPLFALLFTWVMAYRCSWGMVFHTESLVALHLGILALSPAASALSLDARGVSEPPPDARFGWPLRLLAVVTVLTYFVSAVSKLKTNGVGWAEGELLRNYVAFDALRKVELGAFHSPIGTALLRFPALFAPMAAGALALELFAPLALVHRYAARIWITAMWAFHMGVWAVMGIGFAYPLTGFAFLGFVQWLDPRSREP